ncbi:hypothetical protein PAF15_04050 [Weissella koreensis]|uniref:hypothetical protein n=1 Tax=Weissella koreensis TaxID=165096 RepID=UPI0022BA6373|nr:hypothetical protein [Weissella koreensis]MCZ9311146.1 hypothetical protein [Weissella koreensis]
MLKKLGLWIIAFIVIIGIGIGAYYLGLSNNKQNNSKDISSESVSKKNTKKRASSYSVDSNYKPAGEMESAISEKSSLMTAKTGAPITAENVKDAREQMRQQGINDGSFSDLDIAKIIDKANSDSLDLKSAIKSIYPHFFD